MTISTRYITFVFQTQSTVGTIILTKSAQISYSIDDHNLARIISDTPARCILLLEDLDCAFPYSRDNDLDSEEEKDSHGRLAPMPMIARSRITLSGLLNVLDSMSSEEGRVTFATVCCVPIHVTCDHSNS